ncbi:MAG TPA: HAMP domain-containing sensor histidine kinase [Candidatus Dormibacteraeota bacterium]|nr:HAMP domain-containing sensor histidine kinase [Candidatus Dormibacteraeota bacterium]
MSTVRVDLVRTGAQRVALAATGIVAGLYLLIAVAVVLIVTHNLTANVDTTLSQWLSSMAAQRAAVTPEFHGPPGQPRFEPVVLWWMYHPDGNYADSSTEAKANNLNLPVSPASIKDAQTLVVSGTDLRVKGGRVGDDWAVVGQSMSSVDQARSNLIQAELLIGPVLLVVVFLGALAIGRRVASPIEQARQRQMDFTANASHELRTPLAVIQAQTSLALAHDRDTDWYQRAFIRVNEESQRMRHLVDDLLWLARFEAMPRSGKAEPVDVGVMAQQAVDRFAAVAEARHQPLSVRLSGDSHVIAASPEWLDHLVGVLLDNACKYTPEQGSIDVRVTAEGNRITLVVDDSGPGIPADQRGQIFDRFRRASDQPGGAGLGLAIADAVVRATNGRWEVSTSAAGGASMAVTWPRMLARPSATRAASAETPPPLARLDA